jgi:hypothetical protein
MILLYKNSSGAAVWSIKKRQYLIRVFRQTFVALDSPLNMFNLLQFTNFIYFRCQIFNSPFSPPYNIILDMKISLLMSPVLLFYL